MTHHSAFRVADLAQNKATPFEFRPGPDQLRALAGELDLLDLRKLSFSGQIEALGSRDWVLTGKLGATVVQPCVVTLDPVTTRIDTEVTRTYLAEMPEIEGDEVEMPEDDRVEALPATLDLSAVMAEALSLSLPLYPRVPGASFGQIDHAAPGTEALTDETAKPFAGLADLLKKGEDGGGRG